MSTITISGRLTKDAEVKETSAGTVTSFSVAEDFYTKTWALLSANSAAILAPLEFLIEPRAFHASIVAFSAATACAVRPFFRCAAAVS